MRGVGRGRTDERLGIRLLFVSLVVGDVVGTLVLLFEPVAAQQNNECQATETCHAKRDGDKEARLFDNLLLQLFLQTFRRLLFLPLSGTRIRPIAIIL